MIKLSKMSVAYRLDGLNSVKILKNKTVVNIYES